MNHITTSKRKTFSRETDIHENDGEIEQKYEQLGNAEAVKLMIDDRNHEITISFNQENVKEMDEPNAKEMNLNRIAERHTRDNASNFRWKAEVLSEAVPAPILSPTRKWEIVWVRVLIIGVFHLAGLYGATLRSEAKWQSQIFGRVISVLSSYSVTAGAHRLWSHKSYKASIAYQLMLMMLMSFVYQNSIYVWARDHRVHHKYSETDADPHNAKRGFFFSHVGWLMLKKHPDVRRKGSSVDMTDLEANPIVMFQHRHYHKLIFFHCCFIMMFLPWYFWNECIKVTFFYMTAYRLMIMLNFTWGINSLAHMYGYKPYNKKIGPVENSLMSYLTFGEGFHNYHHTFPYDYKAGEYSDGRNTTTKFIDFFAWLGWVWERKIASEDVINERKKNGDGYDNCEHGWSKKCMDWGRMIFMAILYGYII